MSVQLYRNMLWYAALNASRGAVPASDFDTYMRDRDDVHVMAYVTISGIPYVFSMHSQPTTWTLQSGVTWSRSFLFFRRTGGGRAGSGQSVSQFDGEPFVALGQEADWQTGISRSGTVELQFGIDADAAQYDPSDDVWASMLYPSAGRSRYHLDPDVVIDPSQLYLEFLSTAGMNSGDTLYSGVETADVFNVITGAASVQRGAYGSDRQWYGPVGSLENRMGGPDEWTTWPDTWAGRIVEVWLAVGQLVNNAFVPAGGFRDSYSRNIFRGPIYDLEHQPTSVTLICQTVDQLLERPAIARPRRYLPGPTDPGSSGKSYIESGGVSLVEWHCVRAKDLTRLTITIDSAVNSTNYTVTVNGTDVTYASDSSATLAEIADGLAAAINAEFPLSFDVDALSDGVDTITLYPNAGTFLSLSDSDANLTTAGEQFPESGVVDISTAGSGLISHTDIGHRIADALNTELVDGTNRIVVQFGNQIDATGDRVVFFRALMELGASGLVDLDQPLTLRYLTGNDPARSALPCVGVTDGALVLEPDTSLTSSVTGTGAVLDWPLPDYYLGPTSTRLYYVPPDGDSAFRATTGDPPRYQGSTNLGDEQDLPAVRLGKSEVLRVAFRNTTTGAILQDGADYYATIDPDTGRGKATTRAKPFTVAHGEQTEEDNAIVLGLLFDNHRLLDAIRYMGISDGNPAATDPYNVLPQGMGAAIRGDWWDHETLNRFQRSRPTMVANNWWIDDAESLRSMLGKVGAAYGLVTQARITPDKGFTISMVDALPPPDTGEVKATITEAWVHPVNNPIRPELLERRVINRVSVSLDRDPIEDEFRTEKLDYVHAPSVRRYGQRRVHRVEMPWRRGDADAIIRQSVVSRIFSAWARPPSAYRVPIVKPEIWALQNGDTVKVTLPFLPNWREGGNTISAAAMRIAEILLEMGPSADTFGEVVVHWWHSQRRPPYVPNLKLWDKTQTSSQYTVRDNLDDGGFSDPGDTRRDVDFYKRVFDALEAGETFKVKLYDTADESSKESRTITAIDDGDPPTITLSSDTSFDLTTGRIVVEFADYDVTGDLSDEQELFAYLCDDELFVLTNDSAETRDGGRYS